jgi:hypothetical protein
LGGHEKGTTVGSKFRKLIQRVTILDWSLKYFKRWLTAAIEGAGGPAWKWFRACMASTFATVDNKQSIF